MRVLTTEIEGVLEIVLDVHADARGWLVETFHARRFAEASLPAVFVQDNAARSRRGALRGLHFQASPGQAKLVRATRGAIFDVAVDLRAGSPSFGRHVARELSEDEPRLLFIPAGFAHGYQALGDVTDVAYKLSAPYDPLLERGVRWDDVDLGIRWPLADPILSDRDRALPLLRHLPP